MAFVCPYCHNDVDDFKVEMFKAVFGKYKKDAKYVKLDDCKNLAYKCVHCGNVIGGRTFNGEDWGIVPYQ